ncbi:MAG: YjgP/YjgQ family permease [Candidatus Omnitrophica bacterium]|nr:YjgP/YjgQ family permease [Candidatus Omnitrophota bacterium]
MRIIDRYVLREFVHSFIYCIIAFIFLYIIADLFNFIDEMLRNHVPVTTILLYYGTFIPTIFVQAAPMAVLLATIYTLTNFKKSNELTAMRISGVSLLSIIKPILYTAALICITVFVINDRVVPELMPISSGIRDSEIREVGKKEEKVIIEDIAIFGAENRIIYAKSFNRKTNELKDVIIHQNDEDHNLAFKFSAQSATWDGSRWVFRNGTTYKLDLAGYILGKPHPFKIKAIKLKETPDDFVKKGRHPEFMNYRQLREYINKFSIKNSATKRKLLVDLYYKTAFPLASLIVIFVAAPMALMIQRGGLLIGMGISIIIGVVFYVVQAICIALGKGGILPPIISVWLANVFFVGLGFYLMKRCR